MCNDKKASFGDTRDGYVKTFKCEWDADEFRINLPCNLDTLSLTKAEAIQFMFALKRFLT